MIRSFHKYQLIVFTCLLALTMCGFNAQSQAWNSARLSVISGGNIEFYFNSLDKYENGVTYTNGTTLGISINDEAPGSALASWTLDFTSNAGQTEFTGEGGNTLDLDRLELTPSNNLGLAAATFSGTLPLSTATQTLVSTALPALLTTDWTTHQVNITYDMGTTTSLIEENPGFYTVEIEFTLEPGF